MKSIFILAAFVLISISAYANAEANPETNANASVLVAAMPKTVQLTGTIMDENNKEMLAGASIYVNGRRYYSDFDGNFSISDLKPGKCQIKVELISYEPAIVEIDVTQYENVKINLLRN